LKDYTEHNLIASHLHVEIKSLPVI